MLRFTRRFFLALALALLAIGLSNIPSVAPRAVVRAVAPADDVLHTLQPKHPRLYVSNLMLPLIKKTIQQDPMVRSWYERLQVEAGTMLTEPPVEHKLVGPRLLAQSRAALHRISTLAALYRLDGDRDKAARALTEMLTAAAFPDWNPSHFLDTAEMTHALAIGYDWLYNYLSAEDRAVIRTAIIEKGLTQGLKIYASGKGWPKAHHNWNQVCNGGMTVGALAIASDAPDVARAIINNARASIVSAMRTFVPDGGWEEGPGYWNYATQYNVYYLAALQSALGTDFGLKKMTGFDDTGLFRIHSIGPLKLAFNFADAREPAGVAPQMFWLAREFQEPHYALEELNIIGDHPDIFHLLWSYPLPSSGHLRGGGIFYSLNTDAIFHGANVAFFRSGWWDRNAVYVGFKGGDNRANHSHLDLGTFVLDALGERWAIDLGPDDYNLPGYFGKQRWTYYRLRTEAHNTLIIDGENQDPSGQAPLVAFHSTPERAFAVADLSDGYKPKVTRARRGIALLDRRQVLVQDEVEASRPVDIVWNFHTRAKIDAQDAVAVLSQGKSKLEARILSPSGARFDVVSANPPPPEAQQPDVHNLVIRLPKKTKQARIAVLLGPSGLTSIPSIEPLNAWIDVASDRSDARPDSNIAPTPLGGLWERSFTASDQTHTNTEFKVEFVSPTGRLHIVSGYRDGEHTWRVRFMPDEEGKWLYRTRSLPAVQGLYKAVGSFECRRAFGAAPRQRKPRL